MDLEQWVIDLLKDIKRAASNGNGCAFYLSSEQVKEIAKAYEEVKWIEIFKGGKYVFRYF